MMYSTFSRDVPRSPSIHIDILSRLSTKEVAGQQTICWSLGQPRLVLVVLLKRPATRQGHLWGYCLLFLGSGQPDFWTAAAV